MSSIRQVVEGVVSGLSRALPEGVECHQIAQPIDADELMRGVFRAPSVHVCLMSAALTGTMGGDPVATLSFSAFLICESVRPDRRTGAALPLVDLLLRRVDRERWGCEAELRRAQNVSARLAYSGELDGRAVTVWEVSWAQGLVMRGASVDDEALHLLRRVSVDFGAVAPEAAPEEPVCEACAAMAGGNAGGGDA